MAQQYRLVYFNGRGMAEAIRWLFAMGDVPYEDVRIEYEPKTEWLEMKPKTPYGHLPVLYIDGEALADCSAICRYIAKLFHLNGKNDMESAQCDSAVANLADLLAKFVNAALKVQGGDPNGKELMEEFETKTFPEEAKYIEAQIQTSGFQVSEEVTWADIYTTCALNMVIGFSKIVINDFPKLKTMMDKVTALPKIQDWIKRRPKSDF